MNSPAIAKGVVEHRLVLLLGSAGDTDEVENGNVLGESYADKIVSGRSSAIHADNLPPAIPFMALSSPTPKLIYC